MHSISLLRSCTCAVKASTLSHSATQKHGRKEALCMPTRRIALADAEGTPQENGLRLQPLHRFCTH